MMSGAGRIQDPLEIAEAWKGEGRDVAVATVVETWVPLRGRRAAIW